VQVCRIRQFVTRSILRNRIITVPWWWGEGGRGRKRPLLRRQSKSQKKERRTEEKEKEMPGGKERRIEGKYATLKQIARQRAHAAHDRYSCLSFMLELPHSIKRRNRPHFPFLHRSATSLRLLYQTAVSKVLHRSATSLRLLYQTATSKGLIKQPFLLHCFLIENHKPSVQSTICGK